VTVVIQCAASKRPDAGHLETRDGQQVDFVANPEAAPANPRRVYARPDDISDDGRTWRQVLLDYNKEPHNNPLGLVPAYQLYENRIYARLVERFGVVNVFILSAGWGLISADFLTPSYDITFSISADPYKRRRKLDRYNDLCMLPVSAHQEVVFFGGKDYLPLFCALTEQHRDRRLVYYNSASPPQLSGCTLKRYQTSTRTNWHYECANAFIDGEISEG
jgi:hypothetical protein